jgi:hypothetical protein
MGFPPERVWVNVNKNVVDAETGCTRNQTSHPIRHWNVPVEDAIIHEAQQE